MKKIKRTSSLELNDRKKKQKNNDDGDNCWVRPSSGDSSISTLTASILAEIKSGSGGEIDLLTPSNNNNNNGSSRPSLSPPSPPPPPPPPITIIAEDEVIVVVGTDRQTSPDKSGQV